LTRVNDLLDRLHYEADEPLTRLAPEFIEAAADRLSAPPIQTSR
jgi:hypothetical protein